MAEPNPIWGLHVVPGAITGALVARGDDGDFEVRDTLTEEAPTAPDALRDRALALLDRPGVRGRAVLIAAPDRDIAVLTGWIPPEQLHLTDDEVFAELHEFVPFELGEGHLVYRSTGSSDARRYLLAGIDTTTYEAIQQWSLRLDSRFHGIGLATPALLRGAAALGVDAPGGVIVQAAGEVTTVLALAVDGPRRHLLPVSATAALDDPAVAAALAEDIVRVADYEHARAQRRTEDPEEAHAPEHDVVVVGGSMAELRAALAPHLGARLAPVDARRNESPVHGPDGAALANELALTYAGAVGAALEAFADPDRRLVLRHPPADVPEYRETAAGTSGLGVKLAVGAVVLALAVVGALVFAGSGDTDGATGLHPPGPGGEDVVVALTPRVGTAGTAPPTTAPRLVAVTARDSAAELRFDPPLDAPTAVERRSPPDGEWSVVGHAEPGGSWIDGLAAGGGTFEWRLAGTDAPPAGAGVEVPIEIELIGGDADRARFRLSRAFLGERVTTEVDTAPGAPLTASAEIAYGEGDEGPTMTVWLPTGLRITVVQVQQRPVERTVRVPEFEPNGTVRRDEAGKAIVTDRVVEDAEDVLHVEAEGSQGAVTTWVRKMTDR